MGARGGHMIRNNQRRSRSVGQGRPRGQREEDEEEDSDDDPLFNAFILALLYSWLLVIFLGPEWATSVS